MTATTPIYGFSDTWNDAGTLFYGIQLDVTDTASDAASKLIQLDVDNVTRFSVDKDGNTVLGGSLSATGGGTLGGTFAGNFTFSGNPAFTGNPDFSGVGNAATIRSDLGVPNLAGSETITGDWNFTGDLTYDGEPVMKKPDGFINVQDYGVDLTGSTADTTAINNALAALVAEGGGTLYFPPGTYNHPTQIEIDDDDIVLEFAPGAVFDCTSLSYNSAVRASGCAFKFSVGTSNSTTLASSAAQYATSIEVTSATGVEPGDIVRIASDKLLQNNVEYTNLNVVESVSGTTVQLKYPLNLEFDTTSNTVSLIFYNTIKRCGVRGSAVFNGGGVTENLGNGLGRIAICGVGVDGFFVEGRIETNAFQGYAVYVDYGHFVKLDGLDMRGLPEGVAVVEGQTSGFYGIVTNRCRTVLMENCKGFRVRHVLDGAECHFMSQRNSVAYETHRGAFGTHENVYECQGDGLFSLGCYSGWVNRPFTTRLTNFRFENCTNVGVSDSVGLAADVGAELYVDNGRITSEANGANLLSSYSRLVWKNTQIDAASQGISLRCPVLENFDISSNIIRITSTASFKSCIEFTTANGTEPLKVVENGRISDNLLLDYTLNGIRVQGADDVTRPANGLLFEGNIGSPGSGGDHVVGLFDAFWYGDDIVCRGNKILGLDGRPVFVDTSDDGKFKSAPIVLDNYGAVTGEGVSSYGAERVIGEGTSTTLTGSATVLEGSIIRRRNPAEGENTEWICTQAGTEGSFTGVTGSISSGSTTLTLTGNTVDKAYSGSFITIAGAGAASANLTTRIVSISADYATAEVATAASTTVSGAAVTRSNPTFMESGFTGKNPIKTNGASAGVGPATPAANWHVSSAGNTQLLLSSSFSNANLLCNFDSPGNGLQGFSFQKSGSTDGSLRFNHAASAADKYLAIDVSGSTDVARFWGTKRVGINFETAPNYTLDVDGDTNVQSGHVYRVDGTQVVGAQQSAIADLNQTISGSYTQAEVQAISDKVDAILAMLRTHGLINT